MKGLIHHIEIYVKDLNKTIEFWDWLLKELGYKVYQNWDLGISYILEDSYIVFVQVESRFKDIDYHRCGVGLNHLAFYGGSKTFIDDLTNRLVSKDVKILYKDRHPYAGGKGYYAVYFEDPDRIKVEIVAD